MHAERKLENGLIIACLRCAIDTWAWVAVRHIAFMTKHSVLCPSSVQAELLLTVAINMYIALICDAQLGSRRNITKMARWNSTVLSTGNSMLFLMWPLASHHEMKTNTKNTLTFQDESQRRLCNRHWCWLWEQEFTSVCCCEFSILIPINERNGPP